MYSKIKVNNKISSKLDIKIEPFDPSKRYTKPHRHNKYLELVYFIDGSGFHFLDQEKFQIAPPIVFIIKKDEVHHWQIDSMPEGYVIIVKDDFLANTLDKHINYQLRQLEAQKAFGLPKDPILNMLFQIASNLTHEQIHNQHIAIEGILKALLTKILHIAPAQAQLETDLTFKFTQLLKNHPKNDVFHYAQQLHTTSQNLNAQCKKRFDKTASEVIAEHIIHEAKRQLVYTNLSVSQIAYESHFKDISHFVKYFKRFEGITPLQYRKLQTS